MIVVKIMGGLGNQMFQYACGRRLSIRLEVPLYLDLSFYSNKNNDNSFTLRNYELDIFNLSASIADSKILRKFNSTKITFRILRKLGFIKIYNEGKGKINMELINRERPGYIVGYWQSEKYFKDIRQVICEDFAFPEIGFDEHLKNIIHSIENSESVGVHIRRGDYATDKQINAIHGLLDLDYYYKSLEMLKTSYPNLKLYLFTDDPDWVKKNFQTRIDQEIIEHSKPVDSYIDMMLMSKCKHNVIANSSYSWWSAWLNLNECKTVIAPKRWFTQGISEDELSNRLPSEWQII